MPNAPSNRVEQLIADRVSIYVRVSRLNLYGRAGRNGIGRSKSMIRRWGAFIYDIL